MAHRGPDGEGVWHDDVAGLAFRRLAIIDLDERSNQPLHLGPWHLVFNGEIYDYKERRAELAQLGHAFVTEGDGEVLLHAWAEWGEQALDRVNGMFAFAIWHDERRELTCARDPFGEKPVYWCRDGERLAFASDIRALPGRAGDARAATRARAVPGARADAADRRVVLRRRAPAAGRAPAALRGRPGRHPPLLDAARGRRAGALPRRRRARCASCSWTRSGCGCAPTCRSGRR